MSPAISIGARVYFGQPVQWATAREWGRFGRLGVGLCLALALVIVIVIVIVIGFCFCLAVVSREKQVLLAA